MSRCRGLWGLIAGHRFEARVTVDEHPCTASLNLGAFPYDELRRIMYYETRHYHGDVCVRCGEKR